ncbi:MAG TPA: ABC transporter permease [Pirellulales bacterium]|jgi:putative ABC transport system permease protein|nr:ABC transporter permease [Pirellulales bacterium]
MRLATIIWRNLLRRPARSLLTASGLAVAVTTVVSFVGITDGFERSYIDLYNSRRVDLIVQRRGNAHNLNRLLDDAVGDELRQLPGVRDALPGQADVLSLPQYDLDRLIVIGWEPGCRLFGRLPLLHGRRLSPYDRQQALIGRSLAASTHLRPGDLLLLYGQQLQVVGVVDSANVYEAGAVFLPLAEMQQLMKTRQVTDFSVSVHGATSPWVAAEVERWIARLDPTLVALPAAQYVKSFDEIGMAQRVAWVIAWIAIVIGAIGMLNTMAMSVAERVREIGTLRAVGWSRRRVVGLVLSESLALSAAGAVAGIVAAICLNHWLTQFPATSGIISGRIAPIVMLKGLSMALLVGMAGAAYPAFWAANLSPTAAMRRR